MARMHGAMDFLLRHGYIFIFVAVFVEQIGLPIPSGPVLLAAGALAGFHTGSAPGGLGQFVTGTFTASGSSQQIIVTGSDSRGPTTASQINGLEVLVVTPEPSAPLYMSLAVFGLIALRRYRAAKLSV